MAKVVAVVNQKGGVGKTTTAVNLAASLAYYGKKILLIDADAQGNATTALGVDPGEGATAFDLLIDDLPITDAICGATTPGLFLAPGGVSLAGADLALAERENRALCLRRSIFPVYEEYDFILIDCPPSLGLLTINALAASHSLLIPCQCEFFSLEGLVQLTRTVEQVQSHYHPTLTIEGIVLTMVTRRLKLTRQVEEEIAKHFPGKLFETKIPRNVRLSEAPSYGKPALAYDRHAKGSRAYLKLAKELLERTQPPDPALYAEQAPYGGETDDVSHETIPDQAPEAAPEPEGGEEECQNEED